MNKYKKQLKREQLTVISETIQWVFTAPALDDDDKLFYSVLAEIKLMADTKLLNVKPVYTISFSAAQAFALRIIAVDCLLEKASYRGNLLHQIANEVHQQYQ